MPKFKVTFVNTFEAENEDKATDDLLSYLKDCVEEEEVLSFDFEEVKDVT